MRRQDRNITCPAEAEAVLTACTVLHLALTNGREPYVVPVNFGYRMAETGLYLYFHSAGEGRKIELIRENPRAAFTLECACAPLSGGENPCAYSYRYKSLLGAGTVRFLSDPEERAAAMNAIMRRQTGREFVFTGQMLARVTLCEIAVTEYSVKAHL